MDVLPEDVMAALDSYGTFPPYLNTHEEVVGRMETMFNLEQAG